MNKPTHPLALLERHGIHLLFGGSEADVLKESTDLVRDIFQHGLADQEQILCINTLTSASDFEIVEKRITRDMPQAKRFRSITLLETSLANKLDFLRNMIIEQGVRYVILNSFEFGALNSRHRMEVFFWLKSLRDAHRCRVIIFTQSGPRRYGTVGQMYFVCASCEEVGAYRQEDKEPVAQPRERTKKPEKPADGIKRDANGEPIYYYDKMKLARLKAEEEERKADDATAGGGQDPEYETLKTKDLASVNVATLH